MTFRFVLFSLIQLLIVGLFLFSNACDDSDDDDSGSSGDTDNDTDTDSDGDGDADDTDTGPGMVEIECDEKDGQETGEKCSREDLCNCDNICGYQVINQEILGKKSSSNYCFARCEPENFQCPGETDICWEVPRKPAFCAATGKINADAFELKLFALSVKRPADENYIGDLKIVASMDGEKLPDKNWGIAKKVRKRYTSLFFNMYREYQKDGTDRVEAWLFTITMTNKKWGKGEFLVENNDFTGVLTHTDYEVGKPEEGRYWLESSAYEGKLKITQAPEPCTDRVECDSIVKGSLSNIKLVSTKYEYDFEKDTDSE